VKLIYAVERKGMVFW